MLANSPPWIVSKCILRCYPCHVVLNYCFRYKEFQKELLRLLWISRLCGEEPSNNSMTSNAPTLKKPSNSPPSVY